MQMPSLSDVIEACVTLDVSEARCVSCSHQFVQGRKGGRCVSVDLNKDAVCDVSSCGTLFLTQSVSTRTLTQSPLTCTGTQDPIGFVHECSAR